MMQALEMLRLVKGHILGQSNDNSEVIKPVAIDIIDLCLSEGIS